MEISVDDLVKRLMAQGGSGPPHRPAPQPRGVLQVRVFALPLPIAGEMEKPEPSESSVNAWLREATAAGASVMQPVAMPLGLHLVLVFFYSTPAGE
uniref:Uncharacterized protein n=1 Tax=viral metagenome TaxID=1070528 RepID=A0A6M3IJX8_9ZZZZ